MENRKDQRKRHKLSNNTDTLCGAVLEKKYIIISLGRMRHIKNGIPGTDAPEVQFGRCIYSTIHHQVGVHRQEKYITDLFHHANAQLQGNQTAAVVRYIESELV